MHNLRPHTGDSVVGSCVWTTTQAACSCTTPVLYTIFIATVLLYFSFDPHLSFVAVPKDELHTHTLSEGAASN